MRDLSTKLLLPAVLAATLSACGQMGGLYLPEDEAATPEALDTTTVDNIETSTSFDASSAEPAEGSVEESVETALEDAVNDATDSATDNTTNNATNNADAPE